MNFKKIILISISVALILGVGLYSIYINREAKKTYTGTYVIDCVKTHS